MKICNILENLITTERQPTKKYSGAFVGKERADRDSVFSHVKHNKTDGHMVTKYNHAPVEVDEGFNFFAELLYQTDSAMDNIHLPKIYSTKKILDKNNNHINVYKAETLIPYSEITPEEATHMMETLFVSDNQRVKTALNANYTNPDNILRFVTMFISISIESVKNRNDLIKSRQLKEAIIVVDSAIKLARKKYMGKYRVNTDLHMGNIMYRRTPYGIQPVINDPIAFFRM